MINFKFYDISKIKNNMMYMKYYERKIIFRILRSYLTKKQIGFIKQNSYDYKIEPCNIIDSKINEIKNRFIEGVLKSFIDNFIEKIMFTNNDDYNFINIKKINIIGFVDIFKWKNMVNNQYDIDLMYCTDWESLPIFVYNYNHTTCLHEDLLYYISIIDFHFKNNENIVYINDDNWWFIDYLKENKIENGNINDILIEYEYYCKEHYYIYGSYYDRKFHVNLF